jgi:hypothetical protein
MIRSIASRFPEVEHLEIRISHCFSPLALDVDEASMQVSVTLADPDNEDCWSVSPVNMQTLQRELEADYMLRVTRSNNCSMLSN